MESYRQASQYFSRTRLSSVESTKEYVKPVPYFSLFKYSTKGEKVCTVFGLLLAILSGCIPPIVNILYGEYCNLMIDRQFPKNTSSSDTTIIEWFGGGEILYNASSDERKDALVNDAVAWGIGCAMFTFLQFLFSLFSVFLLCHMATRQVSRIKILFFQSVLCKDLTWFETKMTGGFAGQISENLHLTEKVTGDVLSVCTYQLTVGFVNVVTCFTFGWLLSLVLIFAIIPVVAIAFFKGKIQGKLAVKEMESNAKAGNIAEEVFSSIKTVVAFGGEENEVKRYANNLKETRGYVKQRGIVSGITNSFSWVIIYASYSIAFIYGVRLIHSSIEKGDSEYTPAVLLIIFFGMLTALTNLGFATSHFDTFSLGRGAAAYVFGVINTESDINPCSGKGIVGTDCKGEIEFKDVHFEYPARRSFRVLRGVNFKTKPGEMVAIVGHSGSGKTTILHLVERLYDPSKGNIYLDGEDIRNLKVSWLREQIAIVNQEPLLFNVSILQNIRFGNMSATEAEVEEAAMRANAHDFIMRLKEGYRTVVGQKGSNLSGGQKQRIAIARALLSNPKILMLDEPTSSLDAASEKIVQAAVEKAAQDRTTIIVTHKISTVTNAHRIIVLENGVVVEQGTHNELVKGNGVYTHLLQSQKQNVRVRKDKKTLNLEATEVIYEDTAVLPPGPRSRFGSIGTLSNLPKTKTVDKNENYLNITYFEIIKWCKPQWVLLIIGSTASFIGGAALPTVCILFAELFGLLSLADYAYVRKKTDIYALILVIVGVGAGICVFLQMYCFAAAGAKLTSRLRIWAFRCMIHQEIGYFDDERNKVGVLCHRLAKEPSDIQGSIGIRLGVVIQGFSTMIISVIVSFLINWKITLVALATMPFIFTGVYLESVFSKRIISAQGRSVENASKIAVEAFSNIKLLACLGRENFFVKKYAEVVKETKKANARKAWLRGFAFAIGQTAPFFGYALTLWYGGVLIAYENLHYKYVIMSSELLIFGAWTLGQSVVVGPSFTRTKIAASKLNALFSRTPLVTDGDVELITEMPKENFITYEKVWFAYPQRLGISVLQDFTINIKSGASVAIVGPSGCGKSTAIQLLLRFYDPTAGIITIDDMDIRGYKLRSLRKRLGLVLQDPVLFDRTIEENIAYGDNSREVPMREIIEAAELANIHSFIMTLPDGYDTKLGPSGTQLSGGQKQRIAIARVLVRNPQILLLDEATSALDPQNESILLEALNKATEMRTTITVGHRLSAIMEADTIYVLDRGLVKEFGTHQELMRQKGLYYSIFANGEANRPGPSMK